MIEKHLRRGLGLLDAAGFRFGFLTEYHIRTHEQILSHTNAPSGSWCVASSGSSSPNKGALDFADFFRGDVLVGATDFLLCLTCTARVGDEDAVRRWMLFRLGGVPSRSSARSFRCVGTKMLSEMSVYVAYIHITRNNNAPSSISVSLLLAFDTFRAAFLY